MQKEALRGFSEAAGSGEAEEVRRGDLVGRDARLLGRSIGGDAGLFGEGFADTHVGAGGCVLCIMY